MSPGHIQALQAFLDAIPFNVLLGMRVIALEPGFAKLEQPFRAELIGDMRRPALHGGVISALLDTAGGAALFSQVGPKDTLSTVDLRVDYLRPGLCEPLYVEARVLRLGNKIGVADMLAYQSTGRETPIATGRGVYSVLRRDE